jgi:chorismate-pyruvate lyase
MLRLKYLLPVLLGALLAGPVLAQDPAATEKLRARLLAGTSATQVLTQYCAELKLAAPPVIRALRDGTAIPAPPEVRAALKADAGETIRHRRVRLACGAQVLSHADNWYLPARLTPEMNRQLDQTETPFGTVVRPLDFHRETLEATPLNGPDAILRIRALLLTRENRPFSLVIENYRPELVTPR